MMRVMYLINKSFAFISHAKYFFCLDIFYTIKLVTSSFLPIKIFDKKVFLQNSILWRLILLTTENIFCFRFSYSEFCKRKLENIVLIVLILTKHETRKKKVLVMLTKLKDNVIITATTGENTESQSHFSNLSCSL